MKRLFSAILASTLAVAAVAASPKYVFYFIGDGMGMGPVMSTLAYNRLVRHNADTLTMATFPVASLVTTYSASSPITDSAAAGTALSTGSKTKNSMLGMNADTVAVYSMAADLKKQGWGVGLVTSVAPDDATPGAFYAHVPARSMYYEIGRQAAACGYDFIAGANFRGLTDNEGKATDLADVFAENNVTVKHIADTSAYVTTDSRVFLLAKRPYSNNNVGYTIDSIPGALSLPVMTRHCLDHLMARSPEHFFMMVEGGNIDHALHANDGAAAVKEIINFDQAIKIAYQFYLQHPDETLIVVTADHDTGGMALGNTTLKYAANLGLVDFQRQSKDAFSEYCKSILKSRRVYTWDDMKDYLSDTFGLFTAIAVTPEQEATLKEAFDNTFNLRNTADKKTLYASFNAFAVDVFTLVNNAIGFGFTTGSHTGNPVPLFAIGAGSDNFTRVTDNATIAPTILSIINK